MQRLAHPFLRGLSLGQHLAAFDQSAIVARRLYFGGAAELVELVVEALVDLRETLLLRFAHARELGFEALVEVLEAALVVAHLAAEQDVADLLDVAVLRAVDGLVVCCHRSPLDCLRADVRLQRAAQSGNAHRRMAVRRQTCSRRYPC